MGDKRNIFITGATGFVGSHLLKCMLDDKDVKPIVLVRDKKGVNFEDRVLATLKYLYSDKDASKMFKRIKIIKGDITDAHCGIDERVRKELVDEIDEIYHCAAIVDFKVPLEEIRKVNVNGVKNILDLGMECREQKRLKKINHISTTYVAGNTRGIFYERDLNVGQRFNNTYEQTKFESESLIAEYGQRGLKCTILRTSILTGDYVSGKTSSFKMLYKPLHLFSTELLGAIPADKNAYFNLLPIDFAASAMFKVGSNSDSANKTFHISSPEDFLVGEFIDIASDFFGFKRPRLIPVADFDMKSLSPVQKELLNPYVPYFNSNLKFDISNAKDVLNRLGVAYPSMDKKFLVRLFSFCVKSGFIKPKRQYVAAG